VSSDLIALLLLEFEGLSFVTVKNQPVFDVSCLLVCRDYPGVWAKNAQFEDFLCVSY
jgi:hypothetical protein